jgi:hypothetical protein
MWAIYDTQYPQYTALNDRMADELEEIWKETVVAKSRYHSGIHLEGLRKTTKNLVQDDRCPGPNREPPEYQSRALPLR